MEKEKKWPVRRRLLAQRVRRNATDLNKKAAAGPEPPRRERRQAACKGEWLKVKNTSFQTLHTVFK